jgi:hypothetical protein
MNSEPTLLDYIKAKLKFWQKTDLHFPIDESENIQVQNEVLPEQVVDGEMTSQVSKPTIMFGQFPWQVPVAFIIALIAQGLLEPPVQTKGTALVLYLAAFVFLAWSYFKKSWSLAENEFHSHQDWPLFRVKWQFLLAGGFLTIFAYISFTGYVFNFINLTLWIISIFCFMAGFLDFHRFILGVKSLIQSIKAGNWKLNITWGTILLIAIVIVIIFFRAYQLKTVPPEMTSDHAEKLLDVQDVLDGQWSIYFPRNTGREFFQFYWTVLVIALFKTGISFMSLKIGMVAAGLLTLPYIYLMAKEFWNRRVAFLALAFAGVAFWPNVISRVGLRFALYPLFTAPALYYLLRGLKNGNRNDFIWAGVAIGLGMHGYSPYRAVPILLLVAVFLYILHKRDKSTQAKALIGTIMMGVTSVMVTLPLIRYAIDNPGIFSYRLATRLSGIERPIPGNPIVIFFDNLKNAMLMFGVNDGNTWLHSIPDRPALDTISAVLFYLGIVLLLIRYIHKRHWLDLFMVISVPILMLPSILSIAFPEENPVLNRTAGAIIPVYIIIAICLDGLLTSTERFINGKPGKVTAFLIAATLIFISARQNYDFLFNQYKAIYRESAGNTTEMGQVIRGFADSVGTPESAWVVGFPYWVDTRLVSIEAGYRIKDYAIWPEHLEETRYIEGPKLFILNTQDNEDLATLMGMYPTAKVTTYTSKVPGRDFLVMLVGPGN